MAVGVPRCPNCGAWVWPVTQDLNAEQIWRCPECNAHGTVPTLAQGDWTIEEG